MAAVLQPQQSQNLLQRRMNQTHYSQPTNMTFMPTHSFLDRSESQAYPRYADIPATEPQMTSNIGRFHAYPQSQMDVTNVNFLLSGTPQSQVMATSHSNPLALDTAFANGFQYPMSFGSSMSAMPQLDHHSSNQWTANMDYVPMSAPATSMRNSSMSTFASSPVIKSEEDTAQQPAHLTYGASTVPRSLVDSVDLDDIEGGTYSTSIDVLMKAIQSKEKGKEDESRRPSIEESLHDTSPNKGRKRYICGMPDCNKSFYQKTHLEIHTRAHTGIKPFVCREPTCGQRFSQLGNLKTHERRHTGERPYKCDICNKTFAQRGNVRAHKIVHTSQKPFTCKLDSCNKQFTQLGNLKSHQNKFHAETIRNLKQTFEKIKEGGSVSSFEKEMWEYFSNLYKNCNKGIKGRGKDRRISNTGLDMMKNEDFSRRDSYASNSDSSSSFYSNEQYPATSMDSFGGMTVRPQQYNTTGFQSMNTALF